MAVVPLVVVGCSSARATIERFPPITCSVSHGDATRAATVRVDEAPAEIAVGEVRFAADYRSHPDGRVLETRVLRSTGELEQRVTYVVPGASRLTNQFGSPESAITGVHEVTVGDGPALRWVCSVAGS